MQRSSYKERKKEEKKAEKTKAVKMRKINKYEIAAVFWSGFLHKDVIFSSSDISLETTRY
jgi:hypothetical protein